MYSVWVRCQVSNLYYDFSLQRQDRNEAEQLQVLQPLSETENMEMPLAAEFGLQYKTRLLMLLSLA